MTMTRTHLSQAAKLSNEWGPLHSIVSPIARHIAAPVAAITSIPCAHTIFEDSRTSLQTWFYVIYLFVVTRHGVSGKELERALGVTYKTAWRMGMQIRKLMTASDYFEVLKGHVKIDEAYVGGRRPASVVAVPLARPS